MLPILLFFILRYFIDVFRRSWNVEDGKWPSRVTLSIFNDVRGVPTKKLYLNGNQITALQKNIFSNLSKLQLLYLGNNKISKLEKDAFLGLTSLTKIHLVKNLINNLPGNIFSSFIVLESLELNKNKEHWIIGCHSEIRYLKRQVLRMQSHL
jgi:hypothetical protein